MSSVVSLNHQGYKITSYLNEDLSRRLVEEIVKGTVTRKTVFRDNWRTLSAQIQINDHSLLLKVPRARNGRRWERFLTFFRGSDALRSFRHLELMSSLGFSAPQPVLAAEFRNSGFVTDSFLCYQFVNGRRAEAQDAANILSTLCELHKRGYLRGDAQLANFLIVNDLVTFIDFRLKKPRFFPQLQKAREVDRFLRSCPEARFSLPKHTYNSRWFHVASSLESLIFVVRNVKRFLRKIGKPKR